MKLRSQHIVRTVSPDEDLLDVVEALRDRAEGARATVRLLPGTYRLARPLVLTERDSNTTFESAEPSNRAVIDGSADIVAWTESIANGRRVLSAYLSGAGRSLYIGDRRAPRPRFPRDATLRIAGVPDYRMDDPANSLFSGSSRFAYADGDLSALGPLADSHSLDGVDALVRHYWVLERMPIRSVDAEERILTSSHRSIFALRADVAESFADYWLENTAATFGERQGEWYFDAVTSTVSYLPTDDEDASGLVASVPMTHSLLEVVGSPAGRATDIHFNRIDFAHTDFRMPSHTGKRFGIREDSTLPDTDFASAPQAAADIEGAISLSWVDNVTFDDIAIRGVGGYGVELRDHCSHVTIRASTFEHLGAGALVINGPAIEDTLVARCTIRRGGEVFPQAAGILVRFAARTRIEDCEISEMEYSGISVGWTWDYGNATTPGTLIRRNHIHHLGMSQLMSDLGGIYTLGEQPGTLLERNWIHDVRCATYGGWGIYLDEATSGAEIRENVIYDISSEAIHLHYGRSNTVSGNLLVGGAHGVIALTRAEEGNALAVTGNMLVPQGTPLYRMPAQLPARAVESESNRILMTTDDRVAVGSGHYNSLGIWVWDAEVPFHAWAVAHDSRSTIAPAPADVVDRIRRRQWATALYASTPITDSEF